MLIFLGLTANIDRLQRKEVKKKTYFNNNSST